MIDDYPTVSQKLSQLIVQRISATEMKIDNDNIESAIDLDSHADSPVVKRVFKIIERKEKYVSTIED